MSFYTNISKDIPPSILFEKIKENCRYDGYIFQINSYDDYDFYIDYFKNSNIILSDFSNSIHLDNGVGFLFYTTKYINKLNGFNRLEKLSLFTSTRNFFNRDNPKSIYNFYDLSNIYPRIITVDNFYEWLNNFFKEIKIINIKSLYEPKKFIRENMKIKKYEQFISESKIPDLTINMDDLLNLFKDSNVDIFRIFNINKDVININSDIEELYNNDSFLNNIDKKNMKIGKLQNTLDTETLLNKKYILKFFFIYDKKSMELEEPKYIILQYFNKDKNKRSNLISYSNKDEINNFYKTLTDATIELSNGDEKYIYKTTNGGNNWEMRNVQMENDEMKSELDKIELQKLINNKKLKIIR